MGGGVTYPLVSPFTASEALRLLNACVKMSPKNSVYDIKLLLRLGACLEYATLTSVQNKIDVNEEMLEMRKILNV